MENIVVIDGKEYEVILKPVEKTDDNKELRTGYEKARAGDDYWYTSWRGKTELESFEDILCVDEDVYLCGNAVTDRKLAEDRTRRNRLLWQLERFSALSRKENIDWNDRGQLKYCIGFNHIKKELYVNDVYMCQTSFAVYFDREDLAKKAINVFYDELVWFFTEYKDTAEFR